MLPVRIFLFFLFFTTVSHSQVVYSLDDDKVYIDSIATIARNTKSDSIKCLYSFRLSKLFLMIQDGEKSKAYLKTANSFKSKFPFLQDAALYYNASSFLEKGDADGFEKTLLIANDKLKKYNNTEAYRLRAILLQNYGIMQQRKSNEKAYMKLLVNEAIPLAKKSGDNELLSGLYKNVAIIFMNNNERELAHEYLEKAENYIDKVSKKSPTLIESKVETYIIKAENLVELQRFYDSKKALDKAFEKVKKYPESNLNDSYFYAEGLYYAKQNKYGEALRSFKKGIAYSKKHQNLLALNRLNFAEYQVFFKLKWYEKAKNNLEYLIENTPILTDKQNYYKELSKVYNEMKVYDKAYFYADRFNFLNDSLNTTKFKREIIELEAKYKKAENEKTITLLQAENENAALIGTNNYLNSVLFGTLSFVLFLSVLFLWIWNKNHRRLSFQKEMNHKQELKTLASQQKLSISNALIDGEEMERRRIARDLHDGLGSMLSSLKIHLNLAEKESPRLTYKVSVLLNDSIKELRNISRNLMPESLLKLGLKHALQDLCVAHSNINTHVEFQYLVPDSKVRQHYEIMIYRIIQELLNNALKYAKASEILISCSQNKNIFFITVEDNGVGFDAGDLQSFEGMGLRNVKNRVGFLNGKFEIESVLDKGTSVYIELIVE